MFISIWAGGMPFNGKTIPSGKSLGGSESAAYYVAKELAALGHQVSVFTTHRESCKVDGVQYEWAGEPSEVAPLGYRFHFAMKTPHDVCVIQRHPSAFAVPVNSKLNILWLHDLALHRSTSAFADTFVNVDKVFTVSDWHKKQVELVYSIAPQHVYATRNGVDYDAVGKALDSMTISRTEKRLVFGSRPERGLEELVGPGGIMERLPDYHLLVAGYDNTTKEMADYYRYLYQRCTDLPNVHIVGHLGKTEFYKMLASCQAYVYPTMFEETSMIAAMEAAACGTPIIGMSNGALPETCGFTKGDECFGHLVLPGPQGVDTEIFVKAIRTVCENPAIYEGLTKAAVNNFQSWAGIAMDWESQFEHFLSEKAGGSRAQIKHMEQVSDIVAMRKLFSPEDIESVLPDFKTNYRFLLEDDFKEHYRRYYDYEKARGVVYGPESLDGNPRFECISDIIKRANPGRVLDYGCAHGHYTINLAKRFPAIGFDGVDLAKSNIDIAINWADDDGVLNVTHQHGDHKNLPCNLNGDLMKYDFIIAAEVLEHVLNPQEVVESLLECLNENGTMCISVPYGPWEAIGYEQHKGWRAHIHYLERQDLKEMFGHFPDYKCLALPHSQNLGHYVLTFSKPEDGLTCGEIDYVRKAKHLVPPQSLSVCMIARNEELNIGRCLSNIAPYADEIIVGVDTTTTDGTRDILDKFGAVHFDIESPLNIGFDEARNLTIEKAKGDWILWIDADETLENIHLLPYYLRQNIYDGYSIKQHHFSAEPAEILQTDLPCRLFRNHQGTKFYGVVHEHPSKDNCNAGPGRTYVIPNIHIMHTGYATEDKRRARYRRNFPLMVRDRKKYPERTLGKFLFVRDLSHAIRYQMEINGNVTDQEVINFAKQGVALWESMIRNSDTGSRYLVLSLPYYFHCASILGAKVIYKGMIAGHQIEGAFMDSESIQILSRILIKDSVQIYEEKYL